MEIANSEIVSLSALLLSIANFWIARRNARKDIERKRRDDLLKIQSLLDESYDLLYGLNGFSDTRNSAKLIEGEKRIEQAVAIDPNHPRVIEYQGHIFEVQGNTELARERYKHSISVDPKRPRPYNCLGLISQPKAAVRYFEKAISLDPQKAALPLYNLAKELVRLGRLDDAELNFRKALSQQPRYADAHEGLAELLINTGRREGAISHYEAAISSDPNHVDSMVGLGALLTRSEETWDQGVAWLEHAHRTNPTNGYAIRMLAAVHADAHKPEKAIAFAEKAVELDPTQRLARSTTQELIAEMKAELAASRGEATATGQAGGEGA